MNYPEVMKNEYTRLSAKINSLEHAIAKLPDGSLEWRKRGDVYRYYHRADGKKVYLSKEKQELIDALAKKSYLTWMLSDAQRERLAISKYLSYHKDVDRAQELLIKQPHIEGILAPHFVGMDEKLLAWEEADYPSSAGYPEHLIHPGPRGKKYRSKAEASIATSLYRHNVPARYEWDKEINGVIYPIDFTIKNPKTGRLVYWEHCGLMDKDVYAANIGTKIKEFASAGIFPDRNLILTFESKEFPFESWMADEIVERWFV